VALSEVTAHTVLRFANADVLPYSYGAFADTVSKYIDQLQKLAGGVREPMRIRTAPGANAFVLARTRA